MQTLLSQSVLVLNRHWIAVHVTSVRRALVLLFGDHARVVTGDYSTHDFESWREFSEALVAVRMITTPSFHIAPPEVIMLTEFSKFPPRQVRFSRRNIYTRDNHTCQYCGRVPPKDELTVDHVIPRSRGGQTTWENVVAACAPCNLKKGGLMPAQAEMFPMQKPYRPSVTDLHKNGRHFPPNYLHESWQDYLYWDSELEP